MKKIVIILFIVISKIGFAQTNEKISMGGFGGPLVQIGKLNSSTFIWMGGGGGLIINHRYFIGGFGENSISNVKANGIYSGSHLEIGHGGFWLGYIQKIGKRSNLFMSGQLGFGKSYQLKNEDKSYYTDYTIIKPCVEYEYVFTNYFKVGAGASYSYFNGAGLPSWSNNSLTGFNFILSFKFGWF